MEPPTIKPTTLIIFILVVATAIGFTAWMYKSVYAMVQEVPASAQQCPAGSYDIGNGACKAEPTGCPYGDSIPLDSPKCVAPKDVINASEEAEKPALTPATPETGTPINRFSDPAVVECGK